MRVAALLGVKDEIELIGPAIAHLRAIGVGHIIASDAGSTDGTAEVLVREARGAGFELLPIDDRDPDPAVERQLSVDALAMARRAGAEWLLFCDADEFWLPVSGRLEAVLAGETADVLRVARHNVPLLGTGPAMPLPVTPADYGAVWLYAPDEERRIGQERLKADPEAAWIAAVPMGKVMVRTAAVVAAGEGGHSAVAAEGAVLRDRRPAGLIVAHVPFSTEARFARKVANIAAAVAASGESWGPGSAWHWKRWLAALERDGGVAAEMARNRITAERMQALRDRGVIRSAASLLAPAQAAGAGVGTGAR